MALAILGRGSLQGLTASGYALTPRDSPHVVRGCKLPRPKRARALSGSGGNATVQNARASSLYLSRSLSILSIYVQCLIFV